MKKIDTAKNIIKQCGGIAKTAELNKAGMQNFEIVNMILISLQGELYLDISRFLLYKWESLNTIHRKYILEKCDSCSPFCK